MPTIAYLGPEKTNTHVAAQKKFGPRAKYMHAPTVDEVFHLVERRRADFGVVPVENSLEGSVAHTLDRFIDFRDTPVVIQGELEQPIQHYLLMHKRARFKNIKVIYSHPQALAQCSKWLHANFPTAERQVTNSTAEAVQSMLHAQTYMRDSVTGQMRSIVKRHENAAVARRELITRGLMAIRIPEQRENKTRFLVLGLEEPRKGARNKTSIVFSLKDRPGALYDALVPFKRERINLTKIESRPSKQKAWEYYFFIDVEGHESEPRLKRALAALKRSALFMRVLGSYPMGRR